MEKSIHILWIHSVNLLSHRIVALNAFQVYLFNIKVYMHSPECAATGALKADGFSRLTIRLSTCHK